MAEVVKTAMFRPEVYLTVDEDGMHTLSVNWVESYENTVDADGDFDYEDDASTEWMDSVIAYSLLQFVHQDGSTTIVKDVRDV